MRKIIFCTVKTRCSIIEAVMKEEKNMKKMKRIPFFLAAALICMGACSPEKESEKPAESVTETVGETKRQPETEISASE